MKTKAKHLAIAEMIDSYRIFPRLFLLSCFLWTVAVGQQLLAWYMMLPSVERGLEATGFASAVFLGSLGFLKMVYTTYSAAGRSWGPAQPTTSTTTVAASTTTATGAAVAP